ncbi:hypothetical protein ACFFRR_007185 [Megaselia abdita]
MSVIVQIVNDKINDWSNGVDATVDSWFLMSSPVPILSIVTVWMLFVLKVGPSMMANKKPFNLKEVLVGYNAFQVLFSAFICYTAIKESNIYHHLTSDECSSQRDRDGELRLYTGAWFYFFSKVIDLLDTIFFVLRKKQNQITFLHVYHHTITAFFSWGYLKFAPGEQGVVVGLLNSFVHIVMYFYYMVSAMGPEYQKYIWWKKYMTKIQLIQFVLILSYMISISAKNCEMSNGLTYFFVINTVIFLYLFLDFYRKTYNKSKKAVQVEFNGKAKTELDCNNNVLDAKKLK